MRKRLNLSLSERTYNDLERIATDYKFASTCELAATLLGLFVRRVVRTEEILNVEQSQAEEIDEMFRELSDWEPTPSNTHVPVRHRRTGNG